MLKVVPANTSGWRNYKTVCVGVSMRNANHNGEALEGMLHWADNNFEDVILDVSDTLNRHNYIAQGIPANEAHEMALRDGDDWLEKNRAIIDALTHRARIIRWDHWLEHPEYKETFRDFERAFSSQPAFHDSVVNDFVSYHARVEGVDAEISDIQFNCGVSYLLEELAVHSIFYGENPCAILYPGKQQSCYKLVRGGKVAGVPRSLANSFFTRMLVYNFDEKSSSVA